MSQLAQDFPYLDADGYVETSPADTRYNCIAWAAGRTDQWWWPEDEGDWPTGSPRERTLEGFTLAFGTLGYVPCTDGSPEPGYEKVVIYALDGLPTHAARQLGDGRWTSKLGPQIDIAHTTPRGVEGPVYGVATVFLRRPVSVSPASPTG
jgi:hypothetical protein